MSIDHWPHEEVHTTEEKAKRESFWTMRTRTLSDEEFVEKIRKSKATMKRWKWTFVLLHLGLIAVILGFIPRVIELTTDLLNMQVPAQPGGMPVIAREIVLTGLTVGFIFGFQFTHSVHALVSMLLPNRPADLLLRYHDLLNEHNILPDSSTSTNT